MVNSEISSAVLSGRVFDLAKLMANKELSPVEVLQAYQARVEAYNGAINAIVYQHKEALQQARQAEKIILNGEDISQKPLLGVPFTVKEALAVQGFPHTSGSFSRRHIIAKADSSYIANLRAAGGIPFAACNMSEMGAQIESDNKIYGFTSNPYNLGRTPGGSSGGDAAAVAAGLTPFGVGADTGGSLRIPAAFCGIYGHKAGAGITEIDGHIPVLEGNLSQFCSIGPLVRHSSDLLPLLALMFPKSLYAGEVKPLDIQALNVYALNALKFPERKTGPDIQNAVYRVATTLNRMGANLIEENIPALEDLRYGFWFWTALAKEDNSGCLANEVTDGSPESLALFRQTVNLIRNRSPRHNAWIINTLWSERLLTPFVRMLMNRVLKKFAATRDALLDLLGDNGILIMPVHPRVAFKHGSSVYRPTDFSYTGVFNALGFPATAVPVGLNQEGLPVSVQIVSVPRNEIITIQVAELLEAQSGGWQSPEAFF